MCQAKPGLRCDSHAESNFLIASNNLSIAMMDAAENGLTDSPKTRIAFIKFKEAQRDYWSSNKGLAALQANPDLQNEFEEAKGLRERRESGVAKIKEATEEISNDKSNQAKDEMIRKQLELLSNVEGAEQLSNTKTLKGFVEESIKNQSNTDKDLRNSYTKILDNGGENDNLAKSIANSSLQLQRLKNASKICDDLISSNQATEERRLAAEAESARQESYERSDTDGFVSQWASGLTAQKHRLQAELAESGGKTEASALFDTNGNIIHNATPFH